MKEHIPIFLASDDRYIPPLSVTLISLDKNSSDRYIYDVYILNGGLSAESKRTLSSISLGNTRVFFIDVSERLSSARASLLPALRDYYTESIFYRLLIPSLFPELARAVYIDCDTVVLADIAELYHTEIGDNLLGAVVDEGVFSVREFSLYSRRWVGVEPEKYFNSGVLVMNLALMREEGLCDAIFSAIESYPCEALAPDQDYLNYFCRDRVFYLDISWNKQPRVENPMPRERLSLVHYNMFAKPWKYCGVLYEEIFWEYAKASPYYGELLFSQRSYTEEDMERDALSDLRLLRSAERLSGTEGGFTSIPICERAR